jgi:serine/threonine protein kinase
VPDTVACKVWQPSELALRNEQHRRTECERFQCEGQILNAVNNPHVLRCFESGSGIFEGKHVEFHALELCVSDLSEFVRTRFANGNPPQPEEILKISQQLAIGIDCFHRQNIILRDVRPENILLRGNGNFCIADPGVALDANGDPTLRVGTATYAAPEHSPTRSGPGSACPESDVYALAKVILMIMTGRPPRSITARQILELPLRFHSEAWADPVCAVLASATSERATRRHSTALALVDDLRRAFDVSVPKDWPNAVRAAPPLYEFTHRPVAIVAVLAAILLVVIVGSLARLPRTFADTRPCRAAIINGRVRALGGVNLRSGASPNSQVVCPVPYGSHLIFLGNANDGWLQVRLLDAPGLDSKNTSGAINSCLGKVGYVYAANVDLECN